MQRGFREQTARNLSIEYDDWMELYVVVENTETEFARRGTGKLLDSPPRRANEASSTAAAAAAQRSGAGAGTSTGATTTRRS